MSFASRDTDLAVSANRYQRVISIKVYKNRLVFCQQEFPDVTSSWY